MDSRTRDRSPSPVAAEFVRFCYRRRRVGWPELYDEMCAVASRGLFRGWGSDELNAEGIGFCLDELPKLAVLVQQVVAEEHGRRVQAGPHARNVVEVGTEGTADAAAESPTESVSPASVRFAAAAAGA